LKVRTLVISMAFILISGLCLGQDAEHYLIDGIYAFQGGDYHKSIEYLDRFLESNPGQEDALFCRAGAKAALEQYDAALVDVNQAIDESPHFAGAYWLRAEIYAHLDQLEKASQDIDKAKELINKGYDRVLDGADKDVASSEGREKALALINRAQHRKRKSDCEGAVSDYYSALAILGSFPEPQYYVYMAIAQERCGDMTGALNTYNNALLQYPGNEGLIEKRAFLKKKIGDVQGYEADMAILHESWLEGRREDEQTLTKTIQSHPTAYNYKLRAQARLDIGNYQGALEDINKAIELDPEDAWRYEDIKTEAQWMIDHPEAE